MKNLATELSIAMFAALVARRLGAAAAAGVVAAIGASAAASPASPSEKSAAFAWGSGLYGETGHGKECTGEPFPAKVEIPGDVRIVAAALSGSTSAAVTTSNALYTWGCGGRGDGRLGFGDIGSQNQLTPRLVESMPEGVVDVKMGETFGLALTGEGRLYSFGKRALGRAAASSGGHGLPGVITAFGAARVTSFSAGREHALAVTDDGRAFSWGVGSSFALGHGDKADVTEPKPLAELAGVRIVAVAAGREHSLFLGADGRLWAAGSDFYGQAGGAMAKPYIKSPQVISVGKRVTAIHAGEYHSVALCDDGSVYVWGGNRDGTLGVGDRADVGSPRHLDTGKFDGRVVAVAAGGGHTLFLTDKGTLYACGRGRNGQLGRGDRLEAVTAPHTEPVEVSSMRGKGTITGIAAGRDHSLAVVRLQ